MYIFLSLCSGLCLIIGFFAFAAIRSDIQIGIVVTCFVGFAVLLGLAYVSLQAADILKKLSGR